MGIFLTAMSFAQVFMVYALAKLASLRSRRMESVLSRRRVVNSRKQTPRQSLGVNSRSAALQPLLTGLRETAS
jgi:hypothetical protein